MSQLSATSEVVAWVAGAVLLLAGVAKLRWPAGTVAALADARLPGNATVVRLLGATEVAAGLGILLVGGRLPAAVAALLYAGFTVFVVRQRRAAGGSCGCFGEERTPVSAAHVAVNVLAAGGTALAAAGAARPLLGALAGNVVALVGTLVLVATCAWLVRLGLTAGAELQAAVALHPEASA
ncbi:MAG: DoxX family membrane protein [Actinobacteria bacterium]|nr:DoxX family membrane protein [Actinomycetota bacterium]